MIDLRLHFDRAATFEPVLTLLGSAWPCSVPVASLVGGGQGGHGPPKIFVEVAAWSNVGYNYIIF